MPDTTPVDLYLISEKSSWKKSSLTNWISSLQKSISKLIFAGYTGSKNPVRNRLIARKSALEKTQLLDVLITDM